MRRRGRRLSVMRTLRVAGQEVLERLKEGRRLVRREALGEVQIIDAVSKAIEMGREPAAELAPGVGSGNGHG